MIAFLERVEGIEPSSSAWKADIISRYTIPAAFNCVAIVPNTLFFVNDDDAKDSTTNAAFTGEGKGAKKRRVAITFDVNIKGIDQWLNKIESLTDSDDCEGCVDYNLEIFKTPNSD